MAKYWKNGVPVSLTDGTNFAYLHSISITGNDIHCFLQEVIGVGNFHGLKYLKNGNLTELTIQGMPDNIGTMKVAGNDVYISGTIRESIGSVTTTAVYWKNGTPVILSSGSGEYQVGGIAVKGNDVAVVANGVSTTTGKSIGVYWKNGTLVSMTDGSHDVNVFDIFLK